MFTGILYFIIGGLVVFSLLLVLVIKGLISRRKKLLFDKMRRDMSDIEGAQNEYEQTFVPTEVEELKRHRR